MSNSKLPNGGFSLSTGSNYMLDGFQFDTEYNAGVYEKARLPEAKGLASLPSGMIPPDSPITSDLPTGVEVEMDLDLSDFTKDASEQLVPLVDHSWLATQPEEDLEGLRSLLPPRFPCVYWNLYSSHCAWREEYRLYKPELELPQPCIW